MLFRSNTVLQLPTVSPEEVHGMYKTAYREFYFRPKYLLRRLWRMRSFEEIKMNAQAMRSIMFVRATAPRLQRDSSSKSSSADRFNPANSVPALEVC